MGYKVMEHKKANQSKEQRNVFPKVNGKRLNRTGLFSWVFWLLWLLVVLNLAWVIFASIVWPAQHTNFKRELEVDKHEIVILGPRIIPFDQEFVEIEVYNASIPAEPLTIIVEIPKDLVGVIEQSSSSRSIELHFSGRQQHEVQILRIRNARISSWYSLSLIPSELTLFTEDNQRIGSVKIDVEPALRATLSRYGNGENNIPILPFITILISAVGLYYQEQQRRRQEIEKNAERERQYQEALRENALKKFTEFRSELKKGQIETAIQILEQIQQDELVQHLSKADLHLSEQLTALAKGDLQNTTGMIFQEDWLEEIASCLAYAVQNHPSDRRKLDILLRELPIDKIQNKDIKAKLIIAREIIGSNTPIQPWKWPLTPEISKLPRFKIPIATLEYDPLRHDRSEDDDKWLFARDRGLFYSEHPITKKLLTVRGATLVQGKDGAGKTALALALGQYRYIVGSEKVFSCYLGAAPGIEQIQFELTSQLLSFIEHHPSYLILLNDEQRLLLAQVLIHILGRSVVLGRLGAIMQTSTWTWLNDAKGEIERQIWRAEALTHLGFLRDVVVKSSSYSFTPDQWVMAFLTCIRSLEFERFVYIVIDAKDAFNWAWYKKEILPWLYQWTQRGLHTITFFPPVVKHTKGLMGEVLLFELSWDKQSLKEMVLHRWNQVYSPRPVDTVFDEAALELLVERSSTPRDIIRTWQKIFCQAHPLPINEEVVKRAIENAL